MANRKLSKPIQFEIPDGYYLKVNGQRIENNQLQELDAYTTLQYGRSEESQKDYNIVLFPDGKGYFDSLRLDVNADATVSESGQEVIKLTLPTS